MKERQTQKVALLSVFYKDGIIEFAQELLALGWRLLASSGTFRHLDAAGLPVENVASLVGGDPILGHKVVTLSRELHAGLLASADLESELAELEGLGLPLIGLVCVDLYPLEDEIAKPDATPASVRGQTDIGGPTMLSAGAKGQRIVVCRPEDRGSVIEWMKAGEPDRELFITALAARADYTVAHYRLLSAMYHGQGQFAGIMGERVVECRYGENAHQAPAYLYGRATDDPLALQHFKVLLGNPGFNNWVDVDRLLATITRIAATFAINHDDVPYIAVGGKHGNACGAAYGSTTEEVIRMMVEGDPLALFGGLVITNFEIGAAEAELLHAHLAGSTRRVLDGVIAPSFTEGAIDHLKRRGDRCSFIVNPELEFIDNGSLDTAPRFRYVRGGFLTQPNYSFVLDIQSDDCTKHGKADFDQELDMLLAHAICQTSNSNTITLVKDGKLIGNGVGQQSRVGCGKVVIMRASDSGHDVTGAVAASDSFFPFTDGVETLIEAGVAAILSTSGSVRDQEVIACCTSKNVPLYLVPDKVGRGFFGH
jgi:phosphoribosylaminoimidazolecarboxamide formyltransferase/IMP cyclohydrolase